MRISRTVGSSWNLGVTSNSRLFKERVLLQSHTDRKNVTNFLYLVLHLACKVTCYFRLFSLVLVSVLRTSINVLSKSKSKNYVTWIANLTKLFLSVQLYATSLQKAKNAWISFKFQLHFLNQPYSTIFE